MVLALLGRIVTGEDAVTVEPEHYKVEFENDRVRVVRITYGPGEKSEMHEHGPGVIVNITPLQTRFTLPDGSTEEGQSPAGTAVWSDAVMHSAQEIGNQRAEAVLIELK
jgi:hypothetical protein